MKATREIPVLDQHQRDRFWARVDKSGDCWMWTGTIKPNGYGKHNIGQVSFNVHRIAYHLIKGAIPDGLEIDHLCRVRACVNPDHLEAVTHRENTLRGTSMAARHAARDKCDNGHPFDGRTAAGNRYCKTCHREQQARRRAAQREITTPDLLRLLAEHTGFFTRHPDQALALAFIDEAAAMRRRAEETAHPSWFRKVPVHQPCPRDGCAGELYAPLGESQWLPDLVCSIDRDHRVEPVQWSRPRWRKESA